MKEIKVTFNDGHEEMMSVDKAIDIGLTIANRFTVEKWKELQNKMDKRKIFSFEDPNFRDLNITVSYPYVENQIKAHQY
ncbi:MAG: hypothetical protein Q4D02_04760 [Clostridia bacterium]|nr:hypothetical protein [Clostridia bacterium]